MSQMTLFKPPDILTERVKELKDNSELDKLLELVWTFSFSEFD
ncbi:MAG: hypothetical protein V7K89_10315 [Nostoc sp.]